MTGRATTQRAEDLEILQEATRLRIDAGQEWVRALDRGLGHIRATWQESARVCSNATWHARSTGADPLQQIVHRPAARADLSSPHARTWWHIHLSALRFDFNCPPIQSLFQICASPIAEWADPYVCAHEAFALLGQSDPASIAMMDGLLAEEEAAGSREVLHVLLHGLWLGHHLPDRAETILQLAALPPLAGPDPVTLMRTAGALRQLGRYREALATIDAAITALPPGDPAFHADLVRERTLITTAHDLTRHLTRRPEQATG
jgi:hypothetical protein